MIDLSLNEIAGHAGFAISAVAYAMRNIVWLRAFALISLALSLYYNLTLEGGVLWLVVFWLSVFMLINLVRITSEIVDSLEAQVTPEMKRVMAVAFPKMHTRDWHRLVNAGELSTYGAGAVLLDLGDQTKEVSILVSGGTIESRPGSRVVHRQPGIFWGELTFFLGENEFRKGSPVTITAGAEGATVLRISYAAIDALSKKSERLRAALAEGVVRSAGIKHGVITWDNGDSLAMNPTLARA